MQTNSLSMIFKKIQSSYKIKTAAAWLKWKWFLLKHFLPLELKRGDWSLDADDFEVIFKEIKKANRSKPVTFVELGCGISTVIFALYLRRLNWANAVISFEGDQGWAQNIKPLIKHYSLDQQISLHHVPYKYSAETVWFDKEKIEEVIRGRLVDMLFVDAPPGSMGPCSRQPAIPFFLPWLSGNCVVFLHDTKREDEIKIVKSWSPYFKGQEFIDTKIGMVLCKNRVSV